MEDIISHTCNGVNPDCTSQVESVLAEIANLVKRPGVVEDVSGLTAHAVLHVRQTAPDATVEPLATPAIRYDPLRQGCIHDVPDADPHKVAQAFPYEQSGLALDGVPRQPTDPHRLAQNFLHNTGIWRYWRGEWWRYLSTHYKKIPADDMKALVNRQIEGMFVLEWTMANKQAQAEQQEQTHPASKQKKRVKPVKLQVTPQLVNSTLQALAGRTLVAHEIDTPAWIDPEGRAEERSYIAFTNGLVDLDVALQHPANALRDHDPCWFSATCLPYPFSPSVSTAYVQSVFEMILGGDKELVDLIQEFFGLSVCFDNSLHKFMILYGDGGNGKSTICAALEAMLGEENVSHVGLEAFGQRFGLTQTLGKLVNIAGDVSELDKVGEGCLKAFTSGTPMLFDRKGIAPLDCRPTARLVLAMNNLPRFHDRSDGLWRRLLLVPCSVKIPEEKIVARMDTCEWWRDNGHLPSLFLWALEGLRRLKQKKGFTQPTACRKALTQYRCDNNPAMTFLLEHCRLQMDTHVAKEVLYYAYQNWCEANGYRGLLTKVNFGREVIKMFPQLKDSKPVKVVSGMRRVDAYPGLRYCSTGWDDHSNS